jgi:hypothetical protein
VADAYRLQLTSQAGRDAVVLRTYLVEVMRALLALERAPLKGHTLTGTLRGVRSLEFSLPGGAYRAAYLVDDAARACRVFAVGPHERFYQLVERRYAALRARGR